MIRQRPIYICKFHEMAFYYWCEVKKKINYEELFLVAIDKHKDLMEWGAETEIRKEINQLDLNDLATVRQLVENPRPQNKLAYRQFRAAMEASVITDILIISPEEPYEKIYKDLSGREHKIFHCVDPRDLKELLRRNQSLRENMGYPRGDCNIILDIDLDFFTENDDQDITHVICEESFQKFFLRGSALWWIYRKARVTTISLEPYWCGGINNSKLILRLLKTHFLNRGTEKVLSEKKKEYQCDAWGGI